MPAVRPQLLVTSDPAAAPAEALRHFRSTLAYTTDCWDVHHDLETGLARFVLLDVRSPELYADGHLPGAANLLQGRINDRNLAAFDPNALFVVYCAGPHCNGADRAAVRLAGLGLRVKKMIGGIEGWRDEGFVLTRGLSPR